MSIHVLGLSYANLQHHPVISAVMNRENDEIKRRIGRALGVIDQSVKTLRYIGEKTLPFDVSMHNLEFDGGAIDDVYGFIDAVKIGVTGRVGELVFQNKPQLSHMYSLFLGRFLYVNSGEANEIGNLVNISRKSVPQFKEINARLKSLQIPQQIIERSNGGEKWFLKYDPTWAPEGQISLDTFLDFPYDWMQPIYAYLKEREGQNINMKQMRTDLEDSTISLDKLRRLGKFLSDSYGYSLCVIGKNIIRFTMSSREETVFSTTQDGNLVPGLPEFFNVSNSEIYGVSMTQEEFLFCVTVFRRKKMKMGDLTSIPGWKIFTLQDMSAFVNNINNKLSKTFFSISQFNGFSYSERKPQFCF